MWVDTVPVKGRVAWSPFAMVTDDVVFQFSAPSFTCPVKLKPEMLRVAPTLPAACVSSTGTVRLMLPA